MHNSPQIPHAVRIHEQVEKSGVAGVQELQNDTAASGLWMVITGLHTMKNHARAKLRLSRGGRAKPGSDGASPYPEHPELLQFLTS
jgi:hypothetical protein